MTAWELWRDTRLIPGFRRVKGQRLADWFGDALILAISLVFLSLLYELFKPVFGYILKQEALGPVLVQKLIHLVFLVFFGLFLFSSLVSLLSGLFLSSDAELIMAAPNPPEKYFRMRFWQSLAPSTGFLLVLWLPMLLALHQAGWGGWFFVVFGLAAPFPLSVVASSLAACALLTALANLPSGRARRVFYFFGAMFVSGIVLAMRLIRPERLTDPAQSASAAAYLRQMAVPEAFWLPSRWCAESLCRLETEPQAAAGYFLLAVAAAGLAYWLACGLAKKRYFQVWLKSRDHGDSAPGASTRYLKWWSKVDGQMASLGFKDVAQFSRQSQQRVQLLFLGCLIATYLYNIVHLPLADLGPVQSAIFLPSCLFSALIVTAVSLRFFFPSTSLEGQGFWMLKSAPLKLRSYLLAKFSLAIGLLLPLAAGLGIFSAAVLGPDRRSLWLGFYFLISTSLGLAALHTGLGAAWSRFDLESPEEMVTGTPGILAAGLSVLYLLAQGGLLVFPLKELHRLSLSHRFTPDLKILLIPAMASLAIHGLVFWMPPRIGRQVLEERG